MMNELERARSALSAIPPDLPRERWHEIGRAAIASGLSIDDIDNWSASATNYKGSKDIEASFRAITPNGGTTAATLYHLAKEWGWKPSKDAEPHLPINHAKKVAQNRFIQANKYNALEIWERCEPATGNHGYILKKRGKPDGLRVYPASDEKLIIAGQDVADYLAVPCYAPDGVTLCTVQFIPSGEGKKLSLPGASFADGFLIVGKITNQDHIYIVEGLGTGWAVNQATGAAAVVCFGAGRMARVAAVLRAKYPATALVIVPDKGKEPDAADVAADVGGQWVTMPDNKPRNYDANDYLQEAGAAALAALLERPQAPPMHYKLLSDEDLSKLPPLQWRIKKVLPETGLAAVFGASGSGKSFLVLDAIQSMAAGSDWFGYKSKPCNVIYCALEGEGGIAGRVSAYRIRHGATSPNIRYLVQPFNLLSDDVAELAKAVTAAGGAAVVILDTLNRAAPGADENDSKSMGEIIAAAKELQTLIGGLVVLVHHTGKDASKGLRGHSSLHAALDAAIEVRRDGNRREWVTAKSKDGEDGEVYPFELQVVELGIDEDNEPINSCVIYPLEKSAEALRRPLPPKSGNQRVVWDELGKIFRNTWNAKLEGAPDTLPEGRPCITLEAAIEGTRAKLVCDPKRQTERTQAAIRGLIDRQLLCHENGFLWCK